MAWFEVGYDEPNSLKPEEMDDYKYYIECLLIMVVWYLTFKFFNFAFSLLSSCDTENKCCMAKVHHLQNQF